MFLESSRYYQVRQDQTITRAGRTVKVVTLRRLPDVSGTPTQIKGYDRLDVMAQRQYGNSTQFWRIADANSELQANDLVSETGRVIEVPEP
jgi:phage tail protein X